MDKKLQMASRISEMASAIQRHADLYYNKADPEITDAEYDSMVDELKVLVAELERLDPLASEIAEGKEVLDKIGATPSYGREVKHSSRMGSLDKANEVHEIVEWFAKYARIENGETPKIAVTPKMDGCAIRINYVDGKLDEAATRGDGEVGQDITDNVLAMKSVPKFIGAGKTCEVRAEAYMPRSVFERLVERGECKPTNPRNVGTGSIMVEDPKITASRDLQIRAYGVIVPDVDFSTESEKRAWMVANLPDVPRVEMQVITIDQFRALALEWEAKRPTLDYQIDGLVVALDNIGFQEDAGWDESGKYPRGKIAFKFRPEQKTAKVIGIDWQVGRTGKLTPMLRISPTSVDGSVIQNISLHNLANVREKNIAVGDDVLIQKAGDIIPECVRVTNRPDDRDDSVFVTMCPSCGKELVMDEVPQPDGTIKNINLWCENPVCPAQLERRILHWVQTLDIMGVGKGIVAGLCQQGLVKDISDLYYLTIDQLRSVTGGDVAAKKAQQAILEKSSVPLAVFLDGLGISGLGTTTSKDVANNFKKLNYFRVVAPSVMRPCDLTHIKGIAELTATKIVDGLRAMSPTIERLVKVVDVIDVEDKKGPLVGMSFVLTGAMTKPRKEIEAAIEKAGGENKGSVSKGVTYLVAADPNSGSEKNLKAKKVGTQVISEAKLWEMIG